MQPAINQPIYDVIIAGAGPVGLFLACELALARCSVLVLEKAPSPHSPLKRLPFGLRGLNALSVEALDRRGLLAELAVPKSLTTPHFTTKPGPSPSPKPQAGGHFAGIQLPADKIDFAQWPYRLPSSTSTQLFSELEELETVLARRAEALGVSIRRGRGITALRPTPEGVTVQAGEQSFLGRWLVGCDGGRSVVRKLGGFDFVGTEPEFTGYTAQVDILDPEKLRPGRNVTPTGMYMQSQPGYLILQDFDGGAFHQAGQPVTLEHMQELTRRISGTDVTLTALHLATTWTDRARQTTAYRRGRVLLAGDAAHIHSPLGGQGINLGLGDALNLGWKLAATIHGHAPAGLLDSYQTERHPVGAQVLDWSRAQVAIMRPNPAAQALHAIVRDLMDTPDGATYFAGRIWGLRTRYDLGAGHPLVGHSAPHFALEDGTTLNEHLRDGRGLLLDFEADETLKAWAGRFGGQIKYVSGRAKEQLGMRAVLVRPDGFVAWASERQGIGSELPQATRH
ncbi:FAD-dependent monooxygenase [Hymenobacter monticola]|uniref:FAD-dependent monooxygenase n=1 Tax=Hymenobacter monticola TaxID=1705399 RepID=A0ABY4B188_9BACT|nr:FAD-dependent monooxygenase [Hymenobacter monticola]UOE32549.1 FAD-dependent monooxygenase [Hymenobacter monticola]